jgi:hypothetical protein
VDRHADYTIPAPCSGSSSIFKKIMVIVDGHLEEVTLTHALCHGLGGLHPTSHSIYPGSIPGRSYKICGGRSDTGTGFLTVLRFPLPVVIAPNALRSFRSVLVQ